MWVLWCSYSEGFGGSGVYFFLGSFCFFYLFDCYFFGFFEIRCEYFYLKEDLLKVFEWWFFKMEVEIGEVGSFLDRSWGL